MAANFVTVDEWDTEKNDKDEQTLSPLRQSLLESSNCHKVDTLNTVDDEVPALLLTVLPPDEDGVRAVVYRCNFCLFADSDSTVAIQHAEKNHRFQCGKCSYFTYTQHNLYKHKTSIHNVKSRSMSFVSSQNLFPEILHRKALGLISGQKVYDTNNYEHENYIRLQTCDQIFYNVRNVDRVSVVAVNVNQNAGSYRAQCRMMVSEQNNELYPVTSKTVGPLVTEHAINSSTSSVRIPVTHSPILVSFISLFSSSMEDMWGEETKCTVEESVCTSQQPIINQIPFFSSTSKSVCGDAHSMCAKNQTTSYSSEEKWGLFMPVETAVPKCCTHAKGAQKIIRVLPSQIKKILQFPSMIDCKYIPALEFHEAAKLKAMKVENVCFRVKVTKKRQRSNRSNRAEMKNTSSPIRNEIDVEPRLKHFAIVQTAMETCDALLLASVTVAKPIVSQHCGMTLEDVLEHESGECFSAVPVNEDDIAGHSSGVSTDASVLPTDGMGIPTDSRKKGTAGPNGRKRPVSAVTRLASTLVPYEDSESSHDSTESAVLVPQEPAEPASSLRRSRRLKGRYIPMDEVMKAIPKVPKKKSRAHDPPSPSITPTPAFLSPEPIGMRTRRQSGSIVRTAELVKAISKPVRVPTPERPLVNVEEKGAESCPITELLSVESEEISPQLTTSSNGVTLNKLFTISQFTESLTNLAYCRIYSDHNYSEYSNTSSPTSPLKCKTPGKKCKTGKTSKTHEKNVEMPLTVLELGEVELDCDDVIEFVAMYQTADELSESEMSLEMSHACSFLPSKVMIHEERIDVHTCESTVDKVHAVSAAHVPVCIESHEAAIGDHVEVLIGPEQLKKNQFKKSKLQGLLKSAAKEKATKQAHNADSDRSSGPSPSTPTIPLPVALINDLGDRETAAVSAADVHATADSSQVDLMTKMVAFEPGNTEVFTKTSTTGSVSLRKETQNLEKRKRSKSLEEKRNDLDAININVGNEEGGSFGQKQLLKRLSSATECNSDSGCSKNQAFMTDKAKAKHSKPAEKRNKSSKKAKHKKKKSRREKSKHKSQEKKSISASSSNSSLSQLSTTSYPTSQNSSAASSPVKPTKESSTNPKNLQLSSFEDSDLKWKMALQLPVGDRLSPKPIRNSSAMKKLPTRSMLNTNGTKFPSQLYGKTRPPGFVVVDRKADNKFNYANFICSKRTESTANRESLNEKKRKFMENSTVPVKMSSTRLPDKTYSTNTNSILTVSLNPKLRVDTVEVKKDEVEEEQEEVVRCEECGFLFMEKQDYLEHMKETHQPAAKKPRTHESSLRTSLTTTVEFKCALCGFARPKRNDIRHHLISVHESIMDTCQRVEHKMKEDGNFTLLVESVDLFI